MQLNNFTEAAQTEMVFYGELARQNAFTPKKSTLPMIEMPAERLSASTASASGRASRHSNLTAQPLSERDARIKAFFSGRSSSEEMKDYGDNELNRYYDVHRFLKGQRVVAERQAVEEIAHQKNRAVSLIREKQADCKVKVAIKKAEKTLKRMKSETARCQAILDEFKHWDLGLKNYCYKEIAKADARDALLAKTYAKPQAAANTTARVVRSRAPRLPAIRAVSQKRTVVQKPQPEVRRMIFCPNVNTNNAKWRK